MRRARWPALPASSVAAKPIESLLVVDAPALSNNRTQSTCLAMHARCNGVMPLRSSQASSGASSSSSASSSSRSRTTRNIALRWSVAPPAAA